jgi:hypothetical protein
MSALPAPKPFLPSDLPRHQLLPRAVLAHAVAAVTGRQAGTVSRDFWPRDPATLALIVRAATAPATSITAGWAAELGATALGAFLGSLQDSAAAALFAAAPRYDLAGLAQLSLPRASSTGSAAWTAEGAPIVVPQGVIAGVPLGPVKKLAIIESCTREVAEAGPEGGEAIITTLVRDAVARQLDISLFSNTAASALRPAGIVNGITPLVASTGTGVDAAIADLRNLVDAIVTAGGSGRPMFFASPGRALVVAGYFSELAGQVFGSASIPSGTLIAVDPRAFASAFGADPEIRVSIEGVIHYEDTTPLQISTGTQGSAVLATPTRSAFQTDVLLIRCILRAAWTLRIPGTAAWINTGLSW